MFKKFILMLLLAFSLNVKSQTLVQSWNKLDDKTKHVYAGCAITMVTGAVTYRLTNANTGWAVFAGFTSGVTAGIVKEVVYDGMMHKGHVDNWDALSTGWGALWGTINLRIIIDLREKRIDEEYEALEKMNIKFQDLNVPVKTDSIPPLQVDSIPH